MRAIRITADGNHEVVTGDVRATKFIREQVGCQWFDAVYLDSNLVAWLDDEGRLNHSPSNHAASLLLSLRSANVGIVAGTVLITRRQGEDNVGLTDGDITGLVGQLDNLKQVLANMDHAAERIRKEQS